MQRSIEIQLQCGDDAQFGQQCAELAEALTLVNLWELRADGDALPCCLGCGGVRYQPPQPCGSPYPCQTILDARGIYATQRGTCFDLACERAARLRLRGVGATVVVIPRLGDDGRPLSGQYHAYVETPDGVQDPARELQDRPGRCAGSCGCEGHGR
ncbi:MAG: hypothetical protein K0V04_15590 [Deltaproteobacteria bacterium]|nr:hypothetical protein [Deltaproteobacteria bacterium]